MASASIGTVDMVASSTLERARHTAEAIADGIGVGPVIHIEELIERDAGDWSGLTRRQIEEQYPNYLAEGRRPPGWEPDEQLASRAMGAIEAIARTIDGGTAVVVTHGGVIYQVEGNLGSSFERIGNLGARWVELGPGGFTLGERIDLLDGVGDIAHTVPDQI